MIAIVMVIATLFAGCNQQMTEKRFVLGRIVYKVDPRANELMKDMEMVLSHIREKSGEKEALPEEERLKLYRNTDSIKRDRRITYNEAMAYHKTFLSEYEFYLGEIDYGSR